MASNPYQPPEADLSRADDGVRPAWGWRVFAVFLGVMLVLSLPFVALQGVQPVFIADVAMTCVSMVGLCGYAFHRRIGTQAFWRRWLPLAITWNVAYALVFPAIGLSVEPGEPPPSLVAGLMFAVPILVPTYIGLFRYGYRSTEWWPATVTAPASDGQDA